MANTRHTKIPTSRRITQRLSDITYEQAELVLSGAGLTKEETKKQQDNVRKLLFQTSN
ncbi:MAG: hypothetical protein ACTSQX_03620 [Candidatus Heimdallarchaeota archaeon]